LIKRGFAVFVHTDIALEIVMAEKRKRTTQPDKHRNSASGIIEIEEAQRRRKEKREELVKQEKVQRRLEKASEKASRPKMSLTKKLAVGGIIVVAALVFIFNGYRIIDLNLNKSVYEQQYEEKQAEKAKLETELSHVNDPAYVEQLARSRYHMLREGELFYVFPQAQGPEAQ